MDHMGDADFNDPPAPAGGAAADPELEMKVTQLESMGFAPAHCRVALKRAGGVEAATEFLFSNAPEELDLMAAQDASEPAAPAAAAEPVPDGKGVYKMVGFASHLGQHTGHGHYVAHLLHPEKGWVFFNDEKVFKSDTPPMELGYVYVYR